MKRTRQERIRLGVLLVAVFLTAGIVVARLVHLQLFLGDRYGKIVLRQSTGQVSIPAPRGLVYDRNGTLVVNNVVLKSLYASPANQTELRNVGRYLDRKFGLKAGTAIDRYSLDVNKFCWIKRSLGEKMADEIEADNQPGLHLRFGTRREYPFGLVGKQVLGFTNIDYKGLAGIEIAWDSLLAGAPGKADIRRDGLQRTYRIEESALVPSVPGRTIVLTIDFTLQDIVEDELKAAVEKYNAKSAMAAFVDCRNGDILALAHFDPAEERPDLPVKIRAVSDQFEPGSVLKAFTAIGLLDGGVARPEDTVYCENGLWKTGRNRLHDDKKHEWLSFTEVMVLSSNIGIGKFSVLLGGENLREVFEQFGIGRKPQTGLPGETGGSMISPSRWTDFEVAALAMGHSVAVNTLQLAVGFAAIANGGELLQPHLILGEVDESGQVTNYRQRQVLSRAASPESAAMVAQMLRGVVERGTATPVQTDVVTIAGKTGTAQIWDPVRKKFFITKYMGSFAGFFPCETPLIAGVVVMEEPQPIHYGGWTAGPAFRKIAERYSLANPDLFATPDRMLTAGDNADEATVEVPDFVGRDIHLVRQVAEQHGITIRCSESSGVVTWQYPLADRLVFAGSEVLIGFDVNDEKATVMPDIKGLSVREASIVLTQAGIDFEFSGNGKVVRQSIRAGVKVADNARCQVKCRSI